MSTILEQSSSACSVSLPAKLSQVKAGRQQRQPTKRRMRETVLSSIPHPLPVFTSPRKREVGKWKTFSSPCRSRGRTATCRRRNRCEKDLVSEVTIAGFQTCRETHFFKGRNYETVKTLPPENYKVITVDII